MNRLNPYLVYVTQPGNGNWREVLRLAGVELFDTITGTSLLNGSKVAMSGDDYTYAFDLSKLPEGKYDLAFRAKDNNVYFSTSFSVYCRG